MVFSRTIVADFDNWLGHPDIALYQGKMFIAYRKSKSHLAKSHTQVNILSTKLPWNSIEGSIGCGMDGYSKSWDMSHAIASDKVLNCPRLSVVDDFLYCVVDEIDVDERGLIVCENLFTRTSVRIMRYFPDGTWGGVKNNLAGILPSRIVGFGDSYYIATHSRSVVHKAGDLPAMADESFSSQYDKEQRVGKLYQMIWKSKDLGHWEVCQVLSESDLNLCEASLFEYKGKLVCLMRENSNRGLPAYYSVSEDGAKWDCIMPARMFGCHRPVGGVLKSGRVLVTYREQSHVMKSRYWARNTFAALYDFEDMNFDQGIILPLDHDVSEKPDGGYTGWVQDEDSNVIYVVNYITNHARKPYICMYEIYESEFGV